MDAAKIASKSFVQKTTKATGNLIGNKIAGKITSVSKIKREGKTQTKLKKFTFHQKKDKKLLMN